MSDTINIIDWVGAKLMPLEEFLRLAEPEDRAALSISMLDPTYRVDGIVCYQQETFGSPHWGNRYYVAFGAGNMCKARTKEPLLAQTYKGAIAIAYCEKEQRTT